MKHRVYKNRIYSESPLHENRGDFLIMVTKMQWLKCKAT